MLFSLNINFHLGRDPDSIENHLKKAVAEIALKKEPTISTEAKQKAKDFR